MWIRGDFSCHSSNGSVQRLRWRVPFANAFDRWTWPLSRPNIIGGTAGKIDSWWVTSHWSRVRDLHSLVNFELISLNILDFSILIPERFQMFPCGFAFMIQDTVNAPQFKLTCTLTFKFCDYSLPLHDGYMNEWRCIPILISNTHSAKGPNFRFDLTHPEHTNKLDCKMH